MGKSIAGPRKIPISVSTSTTNVTVSTNQDHELNSNHDDVVAADSVEGVEHSESIDGTSQAAVSDSKQENEKDSIEVETVNEEETTNGRQVQEETHAIGIEQKDGETQTIGINADNVNTKTAEDEAWEEVSE